MFIRPVPFVGIAMVATLLIALWWITRDDEQGAGSDIATETPATAPVVAEAAGAAAKAGETLPDASSDDEGTPDTSTTVDGASGSSESPFATAEPVDDGAVSTPGSTSSSDSDPVAADDAPDGLADDTPARTGNPVVVPSSYPVSEAANYYIPPEERGPGNLGGPPPLDFPGGPNDPNSGGDGFAPPAGPGR